MHVLITRTIASPGCSISGSGFCSTLTRCGPRYVIASIKNYFMESRWDTQDEEKYMYCLGRKSLIAFIPPKKRASFPFLKV